MSFLTEKTAADFRLTVCVRRVNMKNMKYLRKDNRYIAYLLEGLQNDQLKKRIGHQLYTYANRAHTYKMFYIMAQWIILLFPVIAIGMEFGTSTWQRVITACLMGSITAVQGLIKGLGVREKWIHYRNYCEKMKKEVSLYQQRIDIYESEWQPDKKLAERIEEIIDTESEEWGKIKVKLEIPKAEV